MSETEHTPDAVVEPATTPNDAVLSDANALLAEIELELAAIDRALNRLDAHRYGACAICGVAIDPQALAADPTEEHCPEHRNSARQLFPS